MSNIELALDSKSSPYPLSRLSAAFEPVDQSIQLAEATRYLNAVGTAKLRVIVDTIERLRADAQRIVEESIENARLHGVLCRFVKRPGHTYHLYRRGEESDTLYFSLLSPEEWGDPPHQFEGSYRLEGDMTWTRVATEWSEGQ